MINQYTSFAYYYDILMEDIDYNMWIEYLEGILQKYNKKPKLILDLACGTGNISLNLAQKGYDTIGIDVSLDMLNAAKEKAYQNNLDILFLNQDMREFELYGTVDTVLCCMDSINYITDENDLQKIFNLVNNYLNPYGLFIFDINTAYKLKHIIGENTYVYDKDEVFCVWESYFDIETQICDFYLTFFGKENEGYKRFDETHQERAYQICEIEKMLRKANLNLVGTFEEFSFEEPNKNTERIFFVAEKNIK